MKYIIKNERPDRMKGFAFKAPPHVAEDLDLLAEIWGVTISVVMRNLVEVGIKETFQELGGRPKTKEQAKLLAKAARRKLEEG